MSYNDSKPGQTSGGKFWSKLVKPFQSPKPDPNQRALQDKQGWSSEQPPPYGAHYNDQQKTTIETVENEDVGDDRYGFLGEVETVLLIDDSTSMKSRTRGRDGKLSTRWQEAREAVANVAPVCTKWDEDGIDIHFLNNTAVDFEKITDSPTVNEIFDSVTEKLQGRTPLGRRLNEVLGGYMDTFKKNQAGTKPLNLIVITDGEPDHQESVKQAIRKVAKELDTLNAVQWQLGIQFFQVGDDEGAKEFLESLDDMMHGMRDIVDTVKYGDSRLPGGKLEGHALLKVVLGAIDKKIDRETVKDMKQRAQKRRLARERRGF